MIIDEENIVQCEILSDQTDNENVEGINKLLLLSRQETADIFKISLPTLKDWEKKGAIPKAIHIGNRVYYRKHEIINFIGIS
jgi:DNA-binding transcriptional regulator YiaG